MLELLQYNYNNNDAADHSSIYYTHNSSSSSSDIASPLPITPTFSRPSHSRYSGSTSSLENIMPPNASSECPISPLQQTHPNKANKTQLPDVQEEPLERDSVDIYGDEDDYDLYSGADEARLGGLYDCLCRFQRGLSSSKAEFKAANSIMTRRRGMLPPQRCSPKHHYPSFHDFGFRLRPRLSERHGFQR